MIVSPRRRSTAADLLRVVAAWLAALLLVQGLAAAQALGQGPLHRHRDAPAATQQAHQHDGAQRHHHDALDGTVLTVADDAPLDAGAFAITAALALMALAVARALRDARRHVWRAASPWAWRTTVPVGLLKPPRLA